jgi:hypothetical protein
MVKITFVEMKKDDAKLYDSIATLFPASTFALADEEILGCCPDIGIAEMEQLRSDILVIAEVLYYYAISRPEKPDTESDTV